MVAPNVVYSNTKPTVHDCTHLDTCEYVGGVSQFSIGDRFRICRMCGEKDRVLNLENHHFSVLNRPRDLVTQIDREEYLEIERSFDKKKSEYRELYRARVLRQVREAFDAGVLTEEDLRVFWAYI